MKRFLLFFVLLMLFVADGVAQTVPRLRAISYDSFNDGAAGVGRIVRDGQDMMWLGTHDGLYRFDGYEFRNFKSRTGDGVDMSSNSIGSLYTSSEGSLWCLIEDRAFFFDLHSYRYVDVLSRLEQDQQQRFKVERLRPLACGITWVFTDDGTIIAINDREPATSARIVVTGEDLERVDAACDAKTRSWILTTNNTYIYDNAQLIRLDQSFSRVMSCGQHVWLLSEAGLLAHYDEANHKAVPAIQTIPMPVEGITCLSGERMALFTPAGVWLLSADGTQLHSTDITWSVQKLIEDSSGRLWFLGKDNHLSTTDGNGRHIERVEGVEMGDFNIHVDRYGTQWFFSKNGDTFYATQQTPTLLRPYENEHQLTNISNTINDGQGGCWLISDKRAYRMTFYMPSYDRLKLKPKSQGRGMAFDSFGRLLIGTRYDKTVTLFNSEGDVIGYLTPDGHISHVPTEFGTSVYRIFSDSRGTMWMGTKSDGIFRLKPLANGSFSVSQYTNQNSSLPDNEVYDFIDDRHGRLWIATHRGGLACITDIDSDTPVILSQGHGLDCWQKHFPIGINSLLITKEGLLMAGTTNGLFVADISSSDISDISFTRHTREAGRAGSLSSNNISHIVQTTDGRIFISTESGGINEMISNDLTAQQLVFLHYDRSTGFPTDMVNKMAEYDGSLWVTAPDRLIEMNLKQKSVTPEVNSFLVNENPHFATALPISIKDGKWVFGTDDGAICIDLKELKHSTFVPPLVITGISIDNNPMDFTASMSDTITLAPGENGLMLWFAALDYEDTENVSYAYRMGNDDSPWIYIGQNRSITLPHLQPDTYRLTIRSTNSDGVWTNNDHTITIIVKPTFWQTPWAILLVTLMILAITSFIAYTYLYIRRIKRQQHETMEKYMALVENSVPLPPSEEGSTPHKTIENPSVGGGFLPEEEKTTEEADDPFMQDFVAFIEKNIGNGDVTIDDIASACAVSRTGLHRKVKHLLGTSPMEFLREARLRKSYSLLARTQKNVSEIAYECGFSDPKYFSKCFKAATGKTPTEFKRDT